MAGGPTLARLRFAIGRLAGEVNRVAVAQNLPTAAPADDHGDRQKHESGRGSRVTARARDEAAAAGRLARAGVDRSASGRAAAAGVVASAGAAGRRVATPTRRRNRAAPARPRAASDRSRLTTGTRGDPAAARLPGARRLRCPSRPRPRSTLRPSRPRPRSSLPPVPAPVALRFRLCRLPRPARRTCRVRPTASSCPCLPRRRCRSCLRCRPCR